jgi:lysylphosphatidylglycerol synthetase-like protein (DUF2156 family)
MTASDVPPGDAGEVPPNGKHGPSDASILGILSIVAGLLVGAITALNVKELVSPQNVQSWENLWYSLLCCQFPGVLLGAVLAIAGVVEARKQKSKRGLWLSVVGLILYMVLFLASIWAYSKAF